MPASRNRSQTPAPAGRGLPEPKPMETAARELVHDAATTRDEPEMPRGHRGQLDHRARGAARCDGRGDARRRAGVRDRRGGRRISGRLQGHAGPARGIRAAARGRYADHRIWLRRPRRRRGDGRAEADRRVHDLQFRHAGDRPHHQFGGQDQLHVGRADALPDRVPRAQWRRRPGRRPAQPELRAVVRQRPGADRHRAL